MRPHHGRRWNSESESSSSASSSGFLFFFSSGGRELAPLVVPRAPPSPKFESLDEVKGYYTAPPGYTWRPVIVDGLNFMAGMSGPDWFHKGFGGSVMAAFAAFIIKV
eukprot:Protomagalhaensia_sp_Gyna_25__341@NODE_115_length_5143_cov_90_356191_g90_i0_p5_GENE_NODE_115_length_5143_cov_90_356191_g90_i0NODE_115_length_5143_cov_90_356191_g90_i0_p5_ORF_typecomplete_len107_score17_74_NODE_115_length_5143_cov_90_356191_g90_i049369